MIQAERNASVQNDTDRFNEQSINLLVYDMREFLVVRQEDNLLTRTFIDAIHYQSTKQKAHVDHPTKEERLNCL